MNKYARLAIAGALIVLVAAVFAIKSMKVGPTDSAPPATEAAQIERQPATPNTLPKLVDLGSVNCIPCKMMAPILKELENEYAGHMTVEFIDVWANPKAGHDYKINLIPTQIFFDAAGNELTRHEGFISKEDILATWKGLGVNFADTSAAQKPQR